MREYISYIGPVAQLVRALPCHGRGRGFEPLPGRSDSFFFILLGILAQLGEHLPYKQRVTGSSPVGPIYTKYLRIYFYTPMWLNWQSS